MNKPEIFRCKAEHYDDSPHYWTMGEDGKERYHHFAREEKHGRRKERTCREHRAPDPVTAEILVSQISLPGFENSTRVEVWSITHSWPVFETKNVTDGVTFKLDFSAPLKYGEKPSGYSSVASGHTSFTTSKGERTFDRRGVEDSFYVRYSDRVEDVQRILEEQLVKIAESRARIDSSISVPGIPFMVTAEQRARISEALKAGRSHQFHPSGFGTGYRLMASPTRWAKRTLATTAEFFGLTALWYVTTDCD